MAERTIKIVVVDDHPVISHGVRSILEKNVLIQVVGEASSVKEAQAVVEKTRPDVILLDISLGGGDGISLIARLLDVSPMSKIIMYTMHRDTTFIARSFQAGALGYVLKSDKMTVLAEAVQRVFQNKIFLSSCISQTVLADLMTGRHSSDNPVNSLTTREFEIASLIARGEKPEEIGNKLHISPKTVRVHRTNIMHKFSCNHVHQLLLQLRQFFPQ